MANEAAARFGSCYLPNGPILVVSVSAMDLFHRKPDSHEVKELGVFRRAADWIGSNV